MALIKLSDYVAKFLVQHGINQVFMVVGGGAMHLDDSLGKYDELKLTFNHHEQACSMAAESYARIHEGPACVCVTTGPGGINAMTGVAGAYLDSIPMFVISGQVRYDTFSRSTGLPLRALGDQEFDITLSAKNMTKYAEMVSRASDIRRIMEKAYHLAVTGRPGPVWVDIPVDIQAKMIDPDKLEAYDPRVDDKDIPRDVSDDTISSVLSKIQSSKRPVLYAGSGIRTSGAYEIFKGLVPKLGIPVVTGWNSIDLIEDSNPLYVGRGGIMGDRAGNFAVQNADLVLAVGNRLSIRQVGYNYKAWAPNAYVIDVDVDRFELLKPTIHVDMPIWADAADFLYKIDKAISDSDLNSDSKSDSNSDSDKKRVLLHIDKPLYKSCSVKLKGSSKDIEESAGEIRKSTRPSDWNSLCGFWKKAYPVITDDKLTDTRKTNAYAFFGKLSEKLTEGSTIVVGNGSACVVGSHSFYIKKDQRFIINSAIASMGYCLPAAIGASIALGGKEVSLVTGDGSIQMNLQELQTIVTNKLPIHIFVINNDGYHSIRQTQTNLFDKHFVGIGPESGGLSFPDLSKLAAAYGYPYYSCHSNEELEESITKALGEDSFSICEVFCSSEQFFEPKSATKKLPDGSLVSPSLDDLAPFLSREEKIANTVVFD